MFEREKVSFDQTERAWPPIVPRKYTMPTIVFFIRTFFLMIFFVYCSCCSKRLLEIIQIRARVIHHYFCDTFCRKFSQGWTSLETTCSIAFSVGKRSQNTRIFFRNFSTLYFVSNMQWDKVAPAKHQECNSSKTRRAGWKYPLIFFESRLPFSFWKYQPRLCTVMKNYPFHRAIYYSNKHWPCKDYLIQRFIILLI